MSFTLFKKNLSTIWKTFLIFFAILAMYGGVIIYMFEEKLAKTLEEYQKLMPEMMKIVGMSGSMGTLTQFVNTYLHGFLLLLIPVIFTVIVVNQVMVKYIDQGSLASILSTGISRKKLVNTQMISLLLSVIVLLVFNSAFTVGAAEVLFPGVLDKKVYLQLAAMLMLLHIAVSGIVFCASCFVNESGQYYLYGAGIPFVFYLIKMMANMGGKLENLKYITIFSLFPDQKIMAGENVFMYAILLVIIAIVTFSVGIWRFRKRDFSI